MKLNEVDDEFENMKYSSAQDRLDFAERRLSGLEHQLSVASNSILAKYNDRYRQSSWEDIKDDERAKGFVSFPRNELRHINFDIYHSLTPVEIQTLSKLYTKRNMLFTMAEKLRKGMSALKLKVKKETGTYVSRQQMNDYERDLGRELEAMIRSTISHAKMSLNYTRTRQNGSSHIILHMTDTLNPGALNKGFSDKKTWRVFLDQIKDAIRSWLTSHGMKQYINVRFEHDSLWKKDSSKPDGGEWIKQRSGNFDVTVESKEMVAYFRNKGK